jgi:5-(carboxyamino)imidazole ribonucleotide mutase
MAKSPSVAILLGSKNDEGHLKATTDLLDRFGIDWELKVLSAHRQPEALHEYVRACDGEPHGCSSRRRVRTLPGFIGSIRRAP